MGGVLAIDHGDLKCGFAITDSLRVALEPLKPLRHEGREERLFEHLEALLAERDVSTLLIGMPSNPDGSAGPRARAVQAFLERLRTRFPELELCTFDERLTTKEAEARLREAGRSGRAARAERDSWSALVLLEDWLRSGEPRGPGP